LNGDIFWAIFQLLGSDGQERVLEGRDRIKKWKADVEDVSPYFYNMYQEVRVPSIFMSSVYKAI
jgi:hypothetical protein